MSANEHIRSTLTNIMPSQSNEMLSYEVFGDSSHLTTCLERDNLFQEEPGKYDLDTVSVFVAKLYQLLDGEEYKEYLTWNETGDVFVICNMDEFAQNVLPKYFKHCKFTSFVRQLNIYGFYRVSDARKSKHVRSKHACVFSHSQFRRGRQDLLPNIRRKVTKTVRRKPRPSESSISQNQGETSPSSVYVNNKNGSIAKDSSSHNLLTSFPESKEFVANADKSDDENAMRKRIAELTVITENLRKDLKSISDIVNDRLIPEVQSLTEDLHKHRTQLMQLTQLVTYHSSTEEIQDIRLFQEVSREYTRHFSSHDFPPAKRIRLDDKQTASIKTEQSNLPSSSVASVPTVPSSSVPNVTTVSAPYGNVFTSHPGNNLMNAPSSSTTDPSDQGAPSVSQSLAIPTNSHPVFSMSGPSIIGELQHSSHNTHPNITGFNESWDTTCRLIQDPVSTVSSSFIFPTATSEHSPILYSPSSNQQNSPTHSQHSPTSSTAPSLSPTEYGDNTATPADLISNTVTTASSSNDDGANSPCDNDGTVSVSATSTTSPMSQPTTTSNYYHTPILGVYSSFNY